MFSDSFNRKVTYLRVSVTDRCNFRCVYCMPAEGIDFRPRDQILRFEEIERIVRIFARHGVKRVRLTGGEPTLRQDLPELVERIASTPGIDEVAMTTNAFLLDRQADALYAAGLRSLNISIDSLQPDRFAEITRIGSLERVERGIDAAMEAGFEKVKLNAVIIRGFNDDEVIDLARYAIERGVVLRYIEYMPIGGEATRWGERGLVPADELRAVLSSHFLLEPLPDVKLGSGPARYWRAVGPTTGSEGARIGFISAVTNCFCAACNRVRLTPEGKLRACLADDNEVDLRELVRRFASDEEIEAAIGRALGAKKETHRFEDGLEGGTQRVMTTIGG